MKLQSHPITTLISLASPLLPTLIAAMLAPTSQDSWSAVGASVAVVFVVADVMKRDKSFLRLMVVGLVSFFTGCTGPGIFMLYHSPEFSNKLTWHGWAFLGLVFGLIGWAVIVSIYGMGPAIGRTAAKIFGAKFGIDTSDQNKKP